MKRKLFIIVFLLIVIDQLSKWLAEMRLPFHQVYELLPVFSLYLTYNSGIAFSWMSWMGSTGLIVMTLIIIAVIFWLWRKLPWDKQLAHLGFAFVISGAVGNLIDRMSQGQVTDFFLLHTPSFSWSFAVFNVADAYITLGAIAIIVDELFSKSEQPTDPNTP